MSSSNSGLSGIEGIAPCQFCESVMVDEDGYCAECGLWRASGEPVNIEPVALPSGEILARLTLPDKNAGIDATRTIELPTGAYTVGRSDADIVVGDPFISRVHAELRVSAAGIEITDKSSTNGTFINDKRLSANAGQALAVGDVLRFGQTDVQWEFLGKTVVEEPTALLETSESMNEPSLDSEDVAIGESIADKNDESQDVTGDISEGTKAETSEIEKPGWVLKCVNREHPEIRLNSGKTVIGRKAGRADVVVTGDGFISSTHISIEIDGDNKEVYITDMSSTNGTFINNEQLEPYLPMKIENGTRIRIGETEFEITKVEAD
jgi:pSer/pThr/pTyr-binding forkhead associated (FHA) protein